MREMDAALDAIYQAALDPGHWPAAMASVSVLFDGRPTLLQINDTKTGELPLTASADIDPAAWEKVESSYATLESNPTLPIAMTIPLDRAVDQAAVIGEELFRRSAINRDVYAPQGHWPFLGTVSARSKSIFAGMSVMRSITGDPPDQAHFHIAERISVHIGRALALGGVFDGKASPAVSFEAALHQASDAVLILDPSGAIVWRNAQAEQLFVEGKGLVCRSSVLAAKDPADQRRLHRAREAAGRGRPSILLIGQPAGPFYVLRIQRLWSAHAVGPGNLIVTVKKARRRARFDQEEAVLLFGLTSAEARVACEVCANAGIEATARSLAISPNTVKSLLGRCFAKVGVRSQAELAMLFATCLQHFGDWPN